MSFGYFPGGPLLTSIERPHCLRCTLRMMLTRIDPGPEGFEHRWFECPGCNSVQDKEIASDPMNSTSEGWLTTVPEKCVGWHPNKPA